MRLDQANEIKPEKSDLLGKRSSGALNTPTEPQKQHTPEKRTTRRMQRQIKEKKNTDEPETKHEEVKQTIDEDKLYLIDPQDRGDIQIPEEVLDSVAEKAIQRAKTNAKRAKKQMEKELNNVLFCQLQKLEMKFEYLKKFKQLYDHELQDIRMIREECLAERVALSALKSQNQPTEEKSLWQNQFA